MIIFEGKCGKSKVMVVERGETGCNVQLNGERLEVVKDFKYLEVILDTRGKFEKEGKNRALVKFKGLIEYKGC